MAYSWSGGDQDFRELVLREVVPLNVYLSYDFTPTIVGDDGGEQIEVPGPWLDVAHTVEIQGVRCYSGRVGEGQSPVPHDGILRFIIPADLPLGGPYDVDVSWSGGGAVTLAAMITVYRRHRRTGAYDLARLFPPAFARGDTQFGSGSILTPTAVVPAVVDILKATIRGGGQILNELAGLLFTRLTADLDAAPAGMVPPPAAALTAYVETTYESEGAPGGLFVRGEEISYSSKTSNTFAGLTRDDSVSQAYPAGEPVFFAGGRSDMDGAREALSVDTAAGAFLDVLGLNLGVPRYGGCDDDTYRRLIRVLAYQAGRGTTTGIGEVLDVIVGASATGTAGTIAFGNRLTDLAGLFRPGMEGLRIRLYGDNDHIYRIESFSNTSQIFLDTQASPFWNAAALANDSSVPWEVLGWDVFDDPWQPGVALIRINSAEPTDPTGFAYLQGGELVTGLLPGVPVATVTVSQDIRQVIGVWATSDLDRSGLNYANDNNFAGKVITLSSAFTPAADGAVLVDYGSVIAPTAPTPGLPGVVEDEGVSQILLNELVTNLGDGQVYPLYLGDRLGLIEAFIQSLTVAGVRARATFATW